MIPSISRTHPLTFRAVCRFFFRAVHSGWVRVPLYLPAGSVLSFVVPSVQNLCALESGGPTGHDFAFLPFPPFGDR